MDIIFSYIYKTLSLKIKSDIAFLVNLSIIEHINRIFIEKFEEFNPTYLSEKNGCGKSTLINSIIGIHKMNKLGKILIEDVEISNLDMYNLRKNKISYMPQKEFFRMVTVKEFIKENIKSDISKIQKNNLFKKLFFF